MHHQYGYGIAHTSTIASPFLRFSFSFLGLLSLWFFGRLCAGPISHVHRNTPFGIGMWVCLAFFWCGTFEVMCIIVNLTTNIESFSPRVCNVYKFTFRNAKVRKRKMKKKKKYGQLISGHRLWWLVCQNSHTHILCGMCSMHSTQSSFLTQYYCDGWIARNKKPFHCEVCSECSTLFASNHFTRSV